MKSEPNDAGVLLERSTRVVLRPLGNPLPLGFLALAGGTFVLGALQLGWLDASEGADVALIVIAFVVPLQLIAAVFGYLARDVVAGTGMGILAGTWLTIGLILFRSPPGATSGALGVLLVVAGAAMCIPAAGAVMGKLIPAAVLLTTAIRFEVTGVFELRGSSAWKTVAGAVGMLLAGLAVYAALAMLLEDVRRETVLPLLRRGAGRTSITGNFDAQLRQVDREAGVREQL
jgi:succinate-acetate transporter protein